MIYEYFKVSDTDESVFDFNEIILLVEFKNDSVQSYITMGRNHHRDEEAA